MTQRIVSLLFGLSVALAAPAAAQTVRSWVASNGSDTNPCSRTLPCRNFNAAIAAVATGGEVVALDSAGYGPTVIDKAVTIVAPPGVHAAIAPAAGDAVAISSGFTGPVIVRGLYLNSQGASYGVRHLGNSPLFVERLVVNGFGQVGIYLSGSAAFLIVDSTIQNNSVGILSVASPGRGVVDRCWIEGSLSYGVWIYGSGHFMFHDVVLSRNDVGVYVSGSGAALDIIDSAAVKNTWKGFWVSTIDEPGSTMHLERCVASNNGTGMQADADPGTSIIRVSNCTITDNGIGVDQGVGGSIQSRRNNTLEANGGGNSIVSPYDAK